jgi:hypothetical protein
MGQSSHHFIDVILAFGYASNATVPTNTKLPSRRRDTVDVLGLLLRCVASTAWPQDLCAAAAAAAAAVTKIRDSKTSFELFPCN